MAGLNYPATASDKRSVLIKDVEETTCFKPWSEKVWEAPGLTGSRVTLRREESWWLHPSEQEGKHTVS